MRWFFRLAAARRAHALALFLALLVLGSASAVELLDAELVAGGSPVLQNASGTLRLEQGRLDAISRKVFVVPEPGMLWQLGSGIGLLAFLRGRRRRRSRRSEKGDDMIEKHRRSRTPWLALVLLSLVAGPAWAQVPQDMIYTGRLVDGTGNPLAGPVDLELRIYEVLAGGTPLYSEQHGGVVLDATGGFSVQLGLGTSPSGTFDADLFSDVDLWLEVVVDNQVLTPRQIIGSVPWALIAERLAPWDPSTPRFEDCGDGTVADHQTGLQWEKKTGTVGSGVLCDSVSCPDPHVVNNLYPWSLTLPDPDGAAFTDFLARLNGTFDPDAATGCFADRCDWRMPKISELQTILIGTEAAPGQIPICFAIPCVDPEFAAVGGPTFPGPNWSTSWFSFPGSAFAWFADFSNGRVSFDDRRGDLSARAVRAGSCH